MECVVKLLIIVIIGINKTMRILGFIHKKWNLFLVNKILVGPRPWTFKYKRILLRNIGYEIGEGTKIVGPITNTGSLIVGNHCWIGANLVIHGNGIVRIGDNCDIAPDVTFLTGGHEIGEAKRRAGNGESYEISVGSGVWIGARSTIARSVIIGNSTVLATCSCVTKSVPENVLVGGVPARTIKSL